MCGFNTLHCSLGECEKWNGFNLFWLCSVHLTCYPSTVTPFITHQSIGRHYVITQPDLIRIMYNPYIIAPDQRLRLPTERVLCIYVIKI